MTSSTEGPTETPSGDAPARVVEDSDAMASAVAGDTTVSPDVLGAEPTNGAAEDPDTPRFQEPVPPDGT